MKKYFDFLALFLVGLGFAAMSYAAVSQTVPVPTGVGTILQESNSAAGSSTWVNANTFAITGLSAGAGIIVSSSSGVGTVTNNGVVSLTAGTGIGITSATGTPTISNNGVLTIGGASSTVALTSSSTIGISTTTNSINLSAKFYPIQAVFTYTTSTNSYDDAIWIPRATSTINSVGCVNQAASDTVTLNFFYGASRNTATSSAFKLFSSDQTITSTSTPTILTINSSSTPGNNQPVRLFAYNASSTELTCTLYYTEN